MSIPISFDIIQCNEFKFSTRLIACDAKGLAGLNRSGSHRYYVFINKCVNDNPIINPAPYTTVSDLNFNIIPFVCFIFKDASC